MLENYEKIVHWSAQNFYYATLRAQISFTLRPLV